MEKEIAEIVGAGFKRYKQGLITLLESRMEDLYGGSKRYPISGQNQSEETEEFVTEIWNTAVKACIDIVKEAPDLRKQ